MDGNGIYHKGNSTDSDQLAHMCRLIKAFDVPKKSEHFLYFDETLLQTVTTGPTTEKSRLSWVCSLH